MASAVCAVCLRVLSATSAGVLRTHGPVSARCQGSGKPPRPPEQVVQPSAGAGPELISPPVSSPSPSLATIPSGRVIRRIPKSARQLCVSKLTYLGGDSEMQFCGSME